MGAILTAFVIEGTVSPEQWEQVLVTALLGGTVLLSFWTADARASVVRAGVLIVALLVLWSIIEAANGNLDTRAV